MRRVDPETGLITSVAGGGSDAVARTRTWDSATASRLWTTTSTGIQAVAFGPDGAMYLAMRFADTVVKVGIDGILNRFAGTGTAGTAQDGLPAAQRRPQPPK